MKTPSILSTPHFSNFVQPPYPATTNHHPTDLPVVLFYWLNRWLCQIWCAILLTDIMNLYMSSLVTLVLEGSWCVVYATRHQVYWGLTHNVIFCWYSDLISHSQTHTQTQTFTSAVMCSRQLSLLHWMNKSLISKFPQCLFFSKIIHL